MVRVGAPDAQVQCTPRRDPPVGRLHQEILTFHSSAVAHRSTIRLEDGRPKANSRGFLNPWKPRQEYKESVCKDAERQALPPVPVFQTFLFCAHLKTEGLKAPGYSFSRLCRRLKTPNSEKHWNYPLVGRQLEGKEIVDKADAIRARCVRPGQCVPKRGTHCG